MFTAAFSQRYY